MPGYRKLGKTSDQRRAMLRQLVTDLLENGRIKTTVTRAKEVQSIAEKMITLAQEGRSGGLPSGSVLYHQGRHRKRSSSMRSGPKYADRNGGYTRVVRIGFRRATPLRLLIWNWCNPSPYQSKTKSPA